MDIELTLKTQEQVQRMIILENNFKIAQNTQQRIEIEKELGKVYNWIMDNGEFIIHKNY